MDERELREWSRRVTDGTINRRQFARAILGLGLTGPMVSVSNKLKGTEISGWDSSFWNLAYWHREA